MSTDSRVKKLVSAFTETQNLEVFLHELEPILISRRAHRKRKLVERHRAAAAAAATAADAGKSTNKKIKHSDDDDVVDTRDARFKDDDERMQKRIAAWVDQHSDAARNDDALPEIERSSNTSNGGGAMEAFNSLLAANRSDQLPSRDAVLLAAPPVPLPIGIDARLRDLEEYIARRVARLGGAPSVAAVAPDVYERIAALERRVELLERLQHERLIGTHD